MVDVNIGVMLPTASARGESPRDVVAAARHAEELGFESVWAVDQLVAGTGFPLLDSLTSLAAAAAATERVRLGVGVLVLPLRPVVWVAKQVATLQHISGDRVLLGVGVGGDRHDRSWRAAGVSRGDRGRLTDAGLRVLPDLISGKSVRLGSGADVQLSPGATVPPIIVGGMADAALRRVAEFGDGWFSMGGAEDLPGQVARLRDVAGAGPEVTGNAMLAIEGDRALPGRASLIRTLTDPDGVFGIPADAAESAFVRGDPGVVGAHLARLRAGGARRVVVTFVGGDWFRQAELLAEACRE
jgi:alkanesulfonate monooxygenase SsuD/methylene tetrahydromethanopterin reductase-like flavin-dependent oxidoreductase (luciferase family)